MQPFSVVRLEYKVDSWSFEYSFHLLYQIMSKHIDNFR